MCTAMFVQSSHRLLCYSLLPPTECALSQQDDVLVGCHLTTGCHIKSLQHQNNPENAYMIMITVHKLLITHVESTFPYVAAKGYMCSK